MRGRGPKKPERPAPKPSMTAAVPAKRDETETLFGLRAALAIGKKRLADVVRIAFDPAIERELAPLLDVARVRGISAEARPVSDLQRIAQTPNHEGVCLEVRMRRFLPPAALAEALVRDRSIALALDRVRNPHNVGAILRTAAFFGIGGVILGAPAPHPALAPDAVRIAEGGAEGVPLVRTTDLAQTLSQLASRGVTTVGVESDGDAEVFAAARTLPRPLVLVVGHEREGLSPRVRAECQRMVRITGVDASFSLNVSIATSIAIAAFAR